MSKELWNTGEAVELKKYLEKHPQFLRALKAKLPKISKEQKIEERAMSGSERKGAEDIFDSIEEMATTEEKVSKSPFIET